MHISFKSEQYHIAHNITEIPSNSCLIHSHTMYEILYMVSGDAKFTIGDAEFELRPHTLLFIPSDIIHGIHVLTDAPYDRYSVHFSPSILHHEQRALLLSSLPSKVNTSCCIYDLEDSGILDMLRQFDELEGSPESHEKLLIAIFLHALIARILIILSKKSAERWTPEQPTHSLHKSELLDYINSHYTEPLTLDSLAAVFYVSKSQLNQTFRQLTGTTVIDYIIHKRIAYAQQLLYNGVSAQQAGTAAGFGDYTSFYRAYKKHMGCSPNQHKREVSHPEQIFFSWEKMNRSTQKNNSSTKKHDSSANGHKT